MATRQTTHPRRQERRNRALDRPMSDSAAASPNRSPCRACPWRTGNQGKRHPDGWYTKANLRRLWAGMRRGEHMSCHPTDPRNPVSEGAQAAGYRPAPPMSEPLQCIGAVILQQREVMLLQKVYRSDLRAYRQARPGGMTREGLMRAVADFLFGDTFLAEGGRFTPDLNGPVSAPGLDWHTPAESNGT